MRDVVAAASTAAVTRFAVVFVRQAPDPALGEEWLRKICEHAKQSGAVEIVRLAPPPGLLGAHEACVWVVSYAPGPLPCFEIESERWYRRRIRRRRRACNP